MSSSNSGIKRTDNRKDHFLPRCYLSGFEHPNPTNRTKPLWVFNMRTLKWSQKSCAQFGHERGFYDYPPESNPDATADDVFMRFENDFPQTREAIRREGYAAWSGHRDVLISFAAMLTARSPLFREQSSSEILPSLAQYPQGNVLAKNYAITNMRSEIPRRAAEWKSFHWVLSYTKNHEQPVITCDHPVAMRSHFADQREAYERKDFWLIFPVAWDMCLVGSAVPLAGEQTVEFKAEYLAELQAYIRKQARLFIVSAIQIVFPPDEETTEQNL